MTFIAAVSALIALLSAIASVVYARRGERTSKRAERNAYLERVRDWADVTVEVVIAAVRICRTSCTEEDFERERGALRTRLSAQIEKGRWFFPNVLGEAVGQRKETAYRGLRQQLLDDLVAIYNGLDELSWSTRSNARDGIIAAQRSFVSEVQLHLDPTNRNSSYQDLVKRYQERDRYLPSA